MRIDAATIVMKSRADKRVRGPLIGWSLYRERQTFNRQRTPKERALSQAFRGRRAGKRLVDTLLIKLGLRSRGGQGTKRFMAMTSVAFEWDIRLTELRS